MKNILAIVFLLTSAVTLAQNKTAKATIEVNGVCEMCEARIEKACLTTKGVKAANWDVQSHQLALVYNEKKTDLETIKQAVLDAGHDLVDAQATDEAYNSLHGCCRYRDKEVQDAH
ncbi:heavy-metal-associated domain-containing protein [Formosa sp. A9]|uniref:heavy-metal-associated domain-containing protein n=1 Tax=Formosa sp. A9 TaxID=3442641 RepID=UPI003EB84EE4